MLRRPRIFISAVTSEFDRTRSVVASILSKNGFDTSHEEIFDTESREICSKLEASIDQCCGFIQIIGRAYGAEPFCQPTKFGRVSFTQYEYFYAQKRKKEICLIYAKAGCTHDTPLDSLDLVPEDSHEDPKFLQAERRSLQDEYLKRLVRNGTLVHEAENDDQLKLYVERYPKDRLHLRNILLFVFSCSSILIFGAIMFTLRWRSQTTLALDGFRVESTAAEAHKLAVDTDELLVSWLSKGKPEEIEVMLEHARTGNRTVPLKVSSAQGRVVFDQALYQNLLSTRNPGGNNPFRVIAKSELESFTSPEIDIRVGITVLVAADPDILTVAALIDDRRLQGYDFQMAIRVPNRDPSDESLVLDATIVDGKTDFHLSNASTFDWIELTAVYLGPSPSEIIRTETLIDDSLKVPTQTLKSSVPVLGGIVEDDRTRRPIVNAVVTVLDSLDSLGGQPATHSDANGKYEFVDLPHAPAGTQVTLKVEKEGYDSIILVVSSGSLSRNFYLKPSDEQ